MRNNTEERPATSAELGAIIDMFSNPRRRSTVAARLDGLLHDPVRSRDLVAEAINNAVMEYVHAHPGTVLTQALVAGIARQTRLERIFTRRLHIPASLLRAGDAFERHKALKIQQGVHVTPDMEPALWDEAVQSQVDAQLADWRAGRRKSKPRALPLHDGRSAVTHEMASTGGLARWREALDELAPHGADREADFSRLDVRQEETPLFTPDAAWLKAHGVTPELASRLTDGQLEAMGVDPDAFHRAVGAISPAPKPSVFPRGVDTRIRRIDLVLHDRGLSECLVAAHPGLRMDAVLNREGLPLRLARTGLAFTKRMAEHPDADRQTVWDEECDRLNAHSKPRGAERGERGYHEFTFAVEAFRARMLDEHHMKTRDERERTGLLSRLAGAMGRVLADKAQDARPCEKNMASETVEEQDRATTTAAKGSVDPAADGRPSSLADGGCDGRVFPSPWVRPHEPIILVDGGAGRWIGAVTVRSKRTPKGPVAVAPGGGRAWRTDGTDRHRRRRAAACGCRRQGPYGSHGGVWPMEGTSSGRPAGASATVTAGPGPPSRMRTMWRGP